MLDQPIGAVTDPHHKSPEVFKIHEKEDDYFNRMGDLEQERLYTSLHDQNQRLKKHIKELKKEFYTLLNTYDAVNGLDMKSLEQQNKELREELKDLTFKKDKVNAVKPETVKPKKQLLKAYGQPDVSQASPGTVTYTDKKQVVAKVDELKKEFLAVEKQIKDCRSTIQKLGIKETTFNEPTHRTVEASSFNPKEMQVNIHSLEARLEALVQEAERLESKCRATEVALIDKTGQLKQEIDSNAQREEKFIAIRSTDPFEMQREIQAAKTREIELSNRIRSLQNLPLYKNDGGANALIRLNDTEEQVIKLRAECDSETNKINTNNAAIERLKKEVEDLHRNKQAVKKDATRTKTMLEAGIARQRDGLFRVVAPTPSKVEPTPGSGTAATEEEYNDKLVRTLGLLRWRGEEPAWYKLQFLQKARKFNPAEPDTILEELGKQKSYKAELSAKLDKVQALLKTAVEEERQREDEHLVQKKKKEHQLLELNERRKELEYNLARITVPNGKKFQGAHPRTGEAIYYNDAVSVFSDDQSDMARIASDENLLDFYLDQIELDPQSTTASLEAVQMPGVKGSNVATMLGINFYNHPTLTSQRVFGSHARVGMLATFAFHCDHFFVQYCKTNSVDVEFFYVGEHNLQLRFAVARIELQDWLDANLNEGRNNIVGVVNKFARVQSLSGQNIGVLTYRLRSRLPVFSTLEVLVHNQHKADGPVAAGVDAKWIDQKRNLSIKVTNGYGFSDHTSAFLTYRVFGFPEVITPRANGKNPRWDHQQNFQVVYNKGVREYLKTHKLEVMAFDDNVPFKQQGPLIDGQGVHLKDFLGSGLIGLAALTFDKPIVEKVYLKNSAGRVTGSIFVRIYFDDMPLAPGDIAEFNREWEEQLSRRIVQEMKNRKLTLRSTFMIADGDGNSEVNKAEFNRVVTEILQIKWAPEEADEYWRRLTRKSGKATCSFGDLLTFYGHLLDRDLLGQQSVSESIKNINNYLNNSEVSGLNAEARDPKHIISLMEKFSAELRRVQKAKSWNDKQLFDAYDTDKNHRLARHEFMIVSEDDLKLKMTPRELEAIFNFLDKDGTGNLDLGELFKAIHFDTAKFLQQELKEAKGKQGEDWSKEKVLLEFIKSVREAMKVRGISIFQFFQLIDKDRSGKISRKEIRAFFEQNLELKIPEKHMVIILSEIDKSNDNLVSVKEFCDFLELEQSLKLLNESSSRKQLGELKVMKDLYLRSCEKELTPEDLVMSMDKDHSGTVDTIELGFYLKEIMSDATVEDIERFLAFLDRDHSKTISLKELKENLEAYAMLVETETQLPAGKLDELLAKLIPIIDTNKESLKEQFGKMEVEPGVIKIEPFRRALIATKVFSKEDVELVVNPICKPFTVKFGRIKYQELFNLKKIYEQQSKLKESTLASYKGAKLVTFIFRTMKKVANKHKMDNFELFQCLNRNDDDHISLKELRKDLLEMKIELTEDQFADLSSQMDKNKDGKISFLEFDAYMRVIEVEASK